MASLTADAATTQSASSAWSPAALGDVSRTQLLVRVVLLLLLVKTATTLYTGLRIRLRFRKLQAQGFILPQPYSPILGHLPLVFAIKRTHLRGVFALDTFFTRFLSLHWETYFPDCAAAGRPPPEVYYLDLWPFVDQPIALVNDATLTQRIVAERVPRRHDQVKILSRGIAGPRSLFEWDGPVHRMWRTRLNPGFSMKNLLGHIATGRMVDEVAIFAKGIKEFAPPPAREGDEAGWGEVFQMFPRAVALTFDIICSVAVDFSPGEQVNGPTEFRLAFDTLRGKHLVFNTLNTLPRRLNPFWHLEYYRCHAILRNWFLPHIHRHLPSHPAARDDDDDDDTTPSAAAARPKTIIGLAVKEVRQEQQEKGAAAVAPSQEFVEDLVGLLKHFIFAGHDTTSITLCFAFHFLTKKPEAMRQLRAEFDDVFGKEDVDKTPDKLRATPALLNSLPFTTAVIKETLRLVPVAAAVRHGGPEFQLVHPETGKTYPTDGFIIIGGTSCLHFNPRIWPKPTEFIPERWLVSEGDPLYPSTKYAFRPFEYGPMGCIGQELALIELKMALLFTVRELEFKTALEEWDREKGIKTEERPTVFGDPIHQVGIGLGPPTENLPMRVRRLKR